jgi:hypothetical protein
MTRKIAASSMQRGATEFEKLRRATLRRYFTIEQTRYTGNAAMALAADGMAPLSSA